MKPKRLASMVMRVLLILIGVCLASICFLQYSGRKNKEKCEANMQFIHGLLMEFHTMKNPLMIEGDDFEFPTSWGEIDKLLPLGMKAPRSCPSGREYIFDFRNKSITCPFAKSHGHELRPGGCSWQGVKVGPNRNFVVSPRGGSGPSQNLEFKGDAPPAPKP